MSAESDLGSLDANPNDVIVALEHLGMIVSRLGELDVAVAGVVPNSLLQLGKIELADVDDAARKLLASVQHLSNTEVYRSRIGDRRHDSLSTVLLALRVWSATEYGGWVPTLGKNRMVAGPRTAGETGWGGVGDPRAVTRDSGWIEPPSRASGPGAGVRVGVLDTALYPNPWLAGGWTCRYSDLLDPQGQSKYSAGHATFLAGLVLAKAPGATVEVRQVLEPDGTRDSWSVAKAIVEIGSGDLDVLNLSFSCFTADGEPPLVLAAAMDRLPPDLVVVAAAGNHAGAKRNASAEAKRIAALPAWPAALDDVLAVGAMDEHGESAPFSPTAPWVDVDALGVGVTSTYLDRVGSGRASAYGGWAEWSGTSFAAATVSGVIAAGVDPGRVPARVALTNILEKLRAGVGAGPWPNGRLRLRTW